MAQTESIQSLAKKVSELAEQKNSEGEFIQAIKRLQIAVEGPAHYVARLRHTPLEWTSILFAVATGVLPLLVENGGKPLSVEELAEKTKADPLLITRFMRILTAINVFDEAGQGRYSSNAVSDWLSQPGQIDGFKIFTRWLLPINNSLFDLYKDNKITQFPDSDKGEKSPFLWTQGRPPWEIMRAEPERKAEFDAYMGARRQGLRLPWYEIYPAAMELDVKGYEKPHEPPLLVDVGGNTGYDAARFKAKNSNIKGRCLVQDLPETLANSDPAAVGMERVGYNFFDPQPIKGARAYMFKAICHDFVDEDCKKFLGNTVAAMSSESSLLIDDFVLPDVGAPLVGGTEDLLMMVFLSGLERTESQWQTLLESIGLEIKKIWRADAASEAIIEAKKRLPN